MRKILISSFLAVVTLGIATTAQARDYWSVSINTPIIVAPERVVRYVDYYEPAPRVVYRSAPVYVESMPYYGHDRNCRGFERGYYREHHDHHGHGHHYGQWR